MTATRRLILVRHAEPLVDPDVPASAWRLSPDGRAAAVEIGRRLAPHRPGACFASPEPKATETASAIASVLDLAVLPIAGLGEQRRETAPFFDDPERFRAAVRGVFERPGERVLGEESGDEARTRFALTIDEVMKGSEAETVIVVTHGTVLALYLAGRTGVDAWRLWASLDFGSHAVLGWETGRLLELDTGG